MKTIYPARLKVVITLWLLSNTCHALAASHAVWDMVFTESEWAGPNIIRVPFTLTGTLITVRARVDTVEGNFFFDTGANGLLLNYRYFSDRRGLADAGGGGVTGKVRVLGSVSVDTFRVDNLLATGIHADILDLSHIERAKKADVVGLIGYAVFKEYEVLFDYDASLLVLVRTDAKGGQIEPIPQWEYRLESSFPFQLAGHIAVVRLHFGSGVSKRFAIDSGAEQNLLTIRAGKRFLKEHFDIRKRAKLRGAGRSSIEVLSGVLQHARLDSIALQPMATLLTNLNDINAAYQTDVDGMLGYEFLSQRPVGINYRKRRINFYVKIRP